ncbi:hypothetical protein DXG01_005368, partial [Tephrocybe rancida]
PSLLARFIPLRNQPLKTSSTASQRTPYAQSRHLRSKAPHEPSSCQASIYMSASPFPRPNMYYYKPPDVTCHPHTGSPHIWASRALPFRVRPDDAAIVSERNSTPCPDAPLLPLVLAVNYMSASVSGGRGRGFDWGATDLVVDASTLRLLLRWIDGARFSFRVDLQLAGKTVLFSRWVPDRGEDVTRTCDGTRFGLRFEEASTSLAPGCWGSAAHYRVVQYVSLFYLSGIRLIVIAGDKRAPATPPQGTTIGKGTLEPRNRVDAAKSLHPAASEPALAIVPGGVVVPQSKIVELKSHSAGARVRWKEYYLQMLFSQTPLCIEAVHDEGHFQKVITRQVESVRQLAIGDHEAADEMQAGLAKLCVLLREIKALVVERGEKGRPSLVCRSGCLEIFRRVREGCSLPAQLLWGFRATPNKKC